MSMGTAGGKRGRLQLVVALFAFGALLLAHIVGDIQGHERLDVELSEAQFRYEFQRARYLVLESREQRRQADLDVAGGLADAACEQGRTAHQTAAEAAMIQQRLARNVDVAQSMLELARAEGPRIQGEVAAAWRAVETTCPQG
jgi:hypothetical protein